MHDCNNNFLSVSLQSYNVDEDGDNPAQLAVCSLSYSLERDCCQTMLLFGGRFALMPSWMPFSHSVTELCEVQPSAILGVPALWNLFYAQFRHLPVASARAAFGPQLKSVSSGTAPLSPEVNSYLQQVFGARYVGSGYGTSETGMIALKEEIVPGVEVRLRDVPELGFYYSDKPLPRGEILVKTEGMATYWKDAARTREAYTEEGYYITGDIGELDEQARRLRVIDRVGDLFKSMNGGSGRV